MKNKGFSLVELMGIIIILSLISLLVIPTVDRSVKRFKEEAYNSQIRTIEAAAKDWVTDNLGLYEVDDGDTVQIILGQLKMQGYIEPDFSNPNTNAQFPDDMFINITRTNKTFRYEVLTQTGVNTTNHERAPIILLNGNYIERINLNSTYTEKGVSIRNYKNEPLTTHTRRIFKDGVEVPSLTTNIAGNYTIHYSVTDEGLTRTIFRQVKVLDLVKPVITLNGNNIFQIALGGTFTDPGATAFDYTDGNLTSSIIVTGTVNTNIEGTYTLTYNVTDSEGNKASPVTRTIVVKEQIPELLVHYKFNEMQDPTQNFITISNMENHPIGHTGDVSVFTSNWEARFGAGNWSTEVISITDSPVTGLTRAQRITTTAAGWGGWAAGNIGPTTGNIVYGVWLRLFSGEIEFGDLNTSNKLRITTNPALSSNPAYQVVQPGVWTYVARAFPATSTGRHLYANGPTVADILAVQIEAKEFPTEYTQGMTPTTNIASALYDTTFESIPLGETAGFINQLSPGTIAVTDAMRYTGLKSLRVQGTGAGTSRIYRSMGILLGDRVTVSADVYSTSPGAHIRLELNGGDYAWNATVGTPHTGNGWERITVTLPYNVTSDTTLFYFIYPMTSNPIYIDNIQVEKLPFATEHVNGTRGVGIRQGRIFDSSGNNFNVDLPQTSSPRWVYDTARRKGVYEFNRTGTAINLSNLPITSITTNNSLTLSAFIKLPNRTITGESAIIRKQGVFQLGLVGDNTIRNLISTNGVTGWVGTNDITYNFQKEVWYHIAVTWNGNTMITYVNGQQVGSATVNGSITVNTESILIGGNLLSGVPHAQFDGRIDEVKIYSRALNPSEIKYISDKY